MPFLLMLLGGLKSAASFIGSWLSKRSLTEIACIALALLCLVQLVSLRGEKRHSAKLQTQLMKANAELKRLSTVKNEQRVVTRDRIVIAERKVKDADGRAKKVEAAPLPGQCRTPPEIMSAGL